jgi:hypothetical protein
MNEVPRYLDCLGASCAHHPCRGRKKDGRGARLVAHLRGRGDVAMSTDEIMALTRDDRMPDVPSPGHHQPWG